MVLNEQQQSSHLPEEQLQPLGLPAALLPPLPGLAGHQGDVVALQEHQRKVTTACQGYGVWSASGLRAGPTLPFPGAWNPRTGRLTMIWTSPSSRTVPLGPAT